MLFPKPVILQGVHLDTTKKAKKKISISIKKLTLPNGDVYEGEVLEGGVITGCGILRSTVNKQGNRHVYRGYFVLGKKHGEGIQIYRNQTRYVGAWRENKRHGTGTLFLPNGSIFNGEFRRGVRHGKGEYTTFSDVTYKGEYRNDVRCGHGVEKNPKKDEVFDGMWQNGRRHGKGVVFKLSDPSVRIEGVWKNGIKVRKRRKKNS